MKIKVTQKELNECIAESIANVLKEEFDPDEIVRMAFLDKKAKKAAQKDVDKEQKQDDDENEKLAGIESAEMDTSEEGEANTETDMSKISYEDLIELSNNPKNRRQLIMAKSELQKRKKIKEEYVEDGIDPKEYNYGYTIDDNGNVQPTHLEVGKKSADAWIGGNGFGGTNFGMGKEDAN